MYWALMLYIFNYYVHTVRLHFVSQLFHIKVMMMMMNMQTVLIIFTHQY